MDYIIYYINKLKFWFLTFKDYSFEDYGVRFEYWLIDNAFLVTRFFFILFLFFVIKRFYNVIYFWFFDNNFFKKIKFFFLNFNLNLFFLSFFIFFLSMFYFSRYNYFFSFVKFFFSYKKAIITYWFFHLFSLFIFKFFFLDFEFSDNSLTIIYNYLFYSFVSYEFILFPLVFFSRFVFCYVFDYFFMFFFLFFYTCYSKNSFFENDIALIFYKNYSWIIWGNILGGELLYWCAEDYGMTNNISAGVDGDEESQFLDDFEKLKEVRMRRRNLKNYKKLKKKIYNEVKGITFNLKKKYATKKELEKLLKEEQIYKENIEFRRMERLRKLELIKNESVDERIKRLRVEADIKQQERDFNQRELRYTDDHISYMKEEMALENLELLDEFAWVSFNRRRESIWEDKKWEYKSSVRVGNVNGNWRFYFDSVTNVRVKDRYCNIELDPIKRGLKLKNEYGYVYDNLVRLPNKSISGSFVSFRENKIGRDRIKYFLGFWYDQENYPEFFYSYKFMHYILNKLTSLFIFHKLLFEDRFDLNPTYISRWVMLNNLNLDDDYLSVYGPRFYWRLLFWEMNLDIGKYVFLEDVNIKYKKEIELLNINLSSFNFKNFKKYKLVKPNKIYGINYGVLENHFIVGFNNLWGGELNHENRIKCYIHRINFIYEINQLSLKGINTKSRIRLRELRSIKSRPSYLDNKEKELLESSEFLNRSFFNFYEIPFGKQSSDPLWRSYLPYSFRGCFNFSLNLYKNLYLYKSYANRCGLNGLVEIPFFGYKYQCSRFVQIYCLNHHNLSSADHLKAQDILDGGVDGSLKDSFFTSWRNVKLIDLNNDYQETKDWWVSKGFKSAPISIDEAWKNAWTTEEEFWEFIFSEDEGHRDLLESG